MQVKNQIEIERIMTAPTTQITKPCSSEDNESRKRNNLQKVNCIIAPNLYWNDLTLLQHRERTNLQSQDQVERSGAHVRLEPLNLLAPKSHRNQRKQQHQKTITDGFKQLKKNKKASTDLLLPTDIVQKIKAPALSFINASGKVSTQYSTNQTPNINLAPLPNQIKMDQN